MAKLTGVQQIEVIVHQTKNLDTTCYRGQAPLAHLAMVTQADIFDQIANPEGLQRDLSPKHASDAYDYVNRNADPAYPRAFPEIVLNVRDKKVIEIEQVEAENDHSDAKLFRIVFDRSKMQVGKTSISRVDGNHRLYYADGDDRRAPLLQSVPFQLHIGLSREQERSLFVDINANQKGLNTSHLAIMKSKLTPEQQEIKDHLDRWIAKRLVDDPASPWHGMIHLGGSKKGTRQHGLTRTVNFVSLETGISKTLTKSQYVHDLTDPNAQYAIIRNYWQAVKTVFSEEWASPKNYLLLKNVGVLSLSILGGTIIDRCIPRGRVDVRDMAYYLGQARGRFDWRSETVSDRSVSGMSGNRAAAIIAAEMAAELSDESGESVIKDLQHKLIEDANSAAG